MTNVWVQLCGTLEKNMLENKKQADFNRDLQNVCLKNLKKLFHDLTDVKDKWPHRHKHGEDQLVRPRFHFTPVSAHKFLTPPPLIPGTEHMQEPYFTTTDHITTTMDSLHYVTKNEHVRGASVQTNGIRIEHTGLYYVYSSIHFNTEHPSSNVQQHSWFHYVHRISPNSPMYSGVLLRSVYTSCLNCTHNQESTFTAGIFHLLKGDLIQVCLSGQNIVDFSKESSYIGLFLLDAINTL